MIKEPFIGLSPSNIDCFEAQLFMRFKKYIHDLHHEECIADAYHKLGVMGGCVFALYDLGSQSSWHYNKAHANAKKIIDNRFSKAKIERARKAGENAASGVESVFKKMVKR